MREGGGDLGREQEDRQVGFNFESYCSLGSLAT